jgi:hypothetical protein
MNENDKVLALDFLVRQNFYKGDMMNMQLINTNGEVVAESITVNVNDDDSVSRVVENLNEKWLGALADPESGEQFMVYENFQ